MRLRHLAVFGGIFTVIISLLLFLFIVTADDEESSTSEIESIADTIGVINHGKMMKEISMKEISEMNTAYIELAATDTKKAAYVLAEKMELNNFKIIDDLKIRIYEVNVTTQEISKELMLNDVEIISINKHTETLEDYFLKMTAEVGK